MTVKDEKDKESRVDIIRTVQTPLGFFVLVVLVIELVFGLTANFSQGADRTYLVVGMIFLTFFLVGLVAFLAYKRPESLQGIRPTKSEASPLKPATVQPETAVDKAEQLPKANDFLQVLLGTQTDKNVYVILSAKQGFEWEQGTPISKPGHTALLSYNEVVAFLKLKDALKQIKERLILVHGDIEDSLFEIDETLIIIGSSHANKVCQSILSSKKIPQIPFRFDKNEKGKGKCINIYQDENGNWSQNPLESFPNFANESSITVDKIKEDFGIILRVTNPRDESGKNKVLIMGGNNGFGTESAVSFVADKDRVNFLHDLVKDQDFEALFQAAANKRQGLKPGIRRLAVLKNGVWIPVKIA